MIIVYSKEPRITVLSSLTTETILMAWAEFPEEKKASQHKDHR